MYTYHTREFVNVLDIDDWLNSFRKPEKPFCEYNMEIIKYDFTLRWGYPLITVRVFELNDK